MKAVGFSALFPDVSQVPRSILLFPWTESVLACSLSHYSDDGCIQMLNTQETLQYYSVKHSEHFIPEECSIPRENRPPSDTSKIVKVCDK